MPVVSGSARTQFTHLGLFSQRYGSFAGKAAAVVLTAFALPTGTASYQAVLTAATASYQSTMTAATASYSAALPTSTAEWGT